jgi:hypothetical protein
MASGSINLTAATYRTSQVTTTYISNKYLWFYIQRDRILS